MQKYDEIKKILKITEDITDNISKALNNDNNRDSEAISKLYLKRKKYLDELNDSIHNNLDITENENLNLKERLKNLTEKDSYNIKKLEDISKETGNDIKNLMNKKALLIYKD
jgi:hypothetical protein